MLELVNYVKQQLILDGVFDIAHSNECARWVWWYDVQNDKMEGFKPSDVYGHSDPKFTPVKMNDYVGWIRGRVIFYGGQYLLMIYTSNNKWFNADVLLKIEHQIESVFNIDKVVDEDGFSLSENTIWEKGRI